MNTKKKKKNAVDEKIDLHTKREPSFTRRSVVKAGWMIPVVLAVGLPPGDLFAQGSNPQSNNTWDNTQVSNNTGGNTQVTNNKGGGSIGNKGSCQPTRYPNRFRGRRNHKW